MKNTDNEELREDLTNIILKYQLNIGIKNYVLVEATEDSDSKHIIRGVDEMKKY